VIVEFLTVEIAPEERAAWLERDEQVWTAFLRTQPGFVGKERWLATDDPGHVHLVIRWATWEAWQAVTDAQVAEVDAGMAELLRVPSCRAYEVV
jgi:uncharacterized protein (TIGR03792 family)